MALRDGRDEVPEPAQRTSWVYGELSRRGVASAEEVGALIQAQLMATMPGNAPAELVQGLLVEGQHPRLRRQARAGGLSMSINNTGEWFKASGELRVDEELMALIVKGAWPRPQRWCPLSARQVARRLV